MKSFIIILTSFIIPILLSNRYLILKYRVNYLWILLLACYGSFSLLGYKYFLPPHSVISFSLQGLIVYFIGIIWMACLIVACFICIDLLINKKQNISPVTSKSAHRFFWYSFIVWSGIFLSILLLVFPGVFSWDSFYFWDFAIKKEYNNSFSASYLWLLAIFHYISSSPSLPLAVQALLLAWIASLWTTEFYKRGLSKKTLLITSGCLALFPQISLFIISLLRDIPYNLILLILLYILYQIVFYSDIKKLSRTLFFTGVLGACCYFFRQNGSIILAFLTVFIILYYKTRKKSLYFILGIVIAFTAYSITWELTDTKDSNGKNIVSIITMPINNTYIYNQGEGLPDDVKKFVEKSGGGEFWLEGDPYHNIILFQKSIKNPEWEAVVYGLSTIEIIRLWISLWIHSPILSLRTRANIISHLWSIYQPIGAPYWLTQPFTLYYTDQEDTGNLGLKFRRPFFIDNLDEVFVDRKVLFFTGGGFYTLLLLIISLYIFLYQDKRKLWLLLFWVANTISLFLASTAIQYRYIWIGLPYVFIMFGMLFIHPISHKEH